MLYKKGNVLFETWKKTVDEIFEYIQEMYKTNANYSFGTSQFLTFIWHS